MAKRPSDSAGRTKPNLGRAKLPTGDDPAPTRSEKLLELLDHCTLAQAAAEGLDEPFLAYLLDMVIEEARAATQGVAPPVRID